MTSAGRHDADLGSQSQRTIHDAHQGNDAHVVVEPRIDDERLQRAVGITLWRRDTLHQLFEQFLNAQSRLGAHQRRIVGRDTDNFFDFVNDLGHIGGRQIDLIDDRQHLESLLQGRIAVGHALGFDALSGINHQQRTLAGRQRSRDLVGKIHVSRRIDEIELIDLAGDRFETERHALCLDGDAALALQIHGIENLRLHLPSVETTALLDESIRQGRFAVIDVSNDRKVADILHQGLSWGANSLLYRSAVVRERLMHLFGVQMSMAHQLAGE